MNLDMRLSEFSLSKGYITVESTLLDDIVVFAADNAVVATEHVVYRASELYWVCDVSDEVLLATHKVKKGFNGVITECTGKRKPLAKSDSSIKWR